MKVSVKIPQVGESVAEATVSRWLVKDKTYVKKNQEILAIETDKASVEVVAEADGQIQILIPEGTVVAVGAEVALIDTAAVAPKESSGMATGVEAAPTTTDTVGSATQPVSNAAVTPSAPVNGRPSSEASLHLSPAVNRLVHEHNLDPSSIKGTGKDGRITKGDVLLSMESTSSIPTQVTRDITETPRPPVSSGDQTARQTRQPMSQIRKRIAERLVMSQQTTATLTTFNEIDMSRVMEIRAKYKDKFKEKYGINLGFMGFFAKAAIEALKAWPQVNAFIEGQDIVYNHFVNLGVAVGTDRGLMVPVIRDADKLSLPQIEKAIRDFAEKARQGKILPQDLQGGTFTISNGGVYGSLLSTPILNPPQTGILGLHKVEDRPVAVNGQVVIRPMMYVALSYDHRMIDGREAVSFLVKIKECMEEPERLLLEV